MFRANVSRNISRLANFYICMSSRLSRGWIILHWPSTTSSMCILSDQKPMDRHRDFSPDCKFNWKRNFEHNFKYLLNWYIYYSNKMLKCYLQCYLHRCLSTMSFRTRQCYIPLLINAMAASSLRLLTGSGLGFSESCFSGTSLCP